MGLLLSASTFVLAEDGEANAVPNDLQGTYYKMTAKASTYGFIKSGTDGLGFYANVGTTTVNANTAMIAIDKIGLLDMKSLDEQATAIEETKAKEAARSAMYDLQGRELKKKPVKGMYIQNNRVYIRQ